jgi:energy-coupling factor transport system substrate-specific component
MSWELASFLIVAAVIVAGFAWYERSRPPSQVVALVAALAALAITGRVAFAAFPNVKPLTTDVIVFAGYALGAAPGFMVGALTALVSNFWFGQGPWTPWQMVAWGLCGVLGAALARCIRNASRLVLAATCGLAALLYGALMNFSLLATIGGEFSWSAYSFWWVQGISFEVAHLGGNVVFALVAGPAMVRMLARFRERFEWSRGGFAGPGRGGRRPVSGMRGSAAAAAIAVLALAALVPAPAHPSPTRAADWLESVQNSDGGWGASPGEDSGSATTDWTMLGLEAAGRNPLDVERAGKTPVDYLRARVEGLKSPGALARTILALSGAGVDPRRFGGRNLVAELIGERRGDGSFEGWPGSTAYAILALRSAGAAGAAKPAAAWLRKVQNDDGGWGDTPGSPSTADGTGAAMMALAGSKAAQRAIGYLREHQRASGGFPLGSGFPVNTQSTAWAVQGILAAGGNPNSFKPAGKTPLDYLAATQQPDGHYRYAVPGSGVSALVANQSPVWTTAQVLAATTETTFPIADVPARKGPTESAVPPKGSTSSPPGPTGSGSAGGSGSIAGLPPAASSPAGPADQNGASPKSSNGARSGSSPDTGGIAPGKVAPSGQAGSEPPAGAGTGLGVPATEGSSPAGEPSRTTEPEKSSGGGDGGSGTAVAILAGLLAGCLLFGVGWAARRGWMRWRYGL